MSRGEIRSYLGYIWFQIIDGEVLVGINEERLDEISELRKIKLPDVGDVVEPDEICAELEADEGSLDVYSPLNGTVLEVNTALSEDPQILLEDPYDDGWLFRVEPASSDELERLEHAEEEEEEDWDHDEDEKTPDDEPNYDA
jgi:glycine cleavage system H protein